MRVDGPGRIWGCPQEHGSLRDLLQNQTLLIEDDMAYSMLKDIVQVLWSLSSVVGLKGCR